MEGNTKSPKGGAGGRFAALVLPIREDWLLLWMEEPGLYRLITRASCPSPTVKFTTLAAMRERERVGWGP